LFDCVSFRGGVGPPPTLLCTPNGTDPLARPRADSFKVFGNKTGKLASVTNASTRAHACVCVCVCVSALYIVYAHKFVVLLTSQVDQTVCADKSTLGGHCVVLYNIIIYMHLSVHQGVNLHRVYILYIPLTKTGKQKRLI